MTINGSVWLTILGMALVTYFTRVGGLFLMNRLTITPRLKAGLEALPGTILISLITPLVLTAGVAEALAALATALVAWRSKNFILAMVTGIVSVWAMRVWLLTTLLLCILGGSAMAFSISSSAFQNEQVIPKKFTCDGADLSPALQWSGAPAATKAFALIMDDPDAPPGRWVHWIIYDLPASVTALAEGVEKKAEGANGSKQGLVWGVDTFSKVGYYGPCPPPGKPHRYYFKLYALDAVLNLPSKATKPQVEAKMRGHILSQTILMGTYGR